jgi:hypothetical protein
MKRAIVVIIATALVIALTSIGTASAGGWAGSRYEKSNCTYTKETNLLYCEATFTHEEFTSEDRAVTDESCPNGTRLIRRTGVRVDTWVGWDLYTGHTPVGHHSIAGNEGLPETTWRDFTDVDLGCV